jgi:uncharacterized protein YodC (DUF2158 family)
MAFKIGTKVKHKSGGPVMVVKYADEGDGDDVEVTCEWVAGDGPIKHVFLAGTLELVEDGKPLGVSALGSRRR